MSTSNTRNLRNTLMWLSCALATQAAATEMVYYPYNPSFGGSPLNGQVLLNSALATNKHNPPDVDSDRYGIEQKTPLQIFKDTLERSVLNNLASAATSKIVGPDGNFIPGIFEMDNFKITIASLDIDTVRVTILDKLTGGSTSIDLAQVIR